MRYFGVVYDTGLPYIPGRNTIDPFDPQLVEYDMKVISEEMRANAVRIEGEDLERLTAATRIAHANGLAVWFNPWKMEANVEETTTYMAEAAKIAEQLRQEGVDLVFVTSCEISIFTHGVYPGETYFERGAWLGSQFASMPLEAMSAHVMPDTLKEKSVVLNEALRKFVAAVRAEFSGPVTYSAGTWEGVDWTPFDFIGLDAYRRGEPADQYVATLKRFKEEGKPIGALEFGSCAYEGAAAKGDAGFAVLLGRNPDGSGNFVDDVVPVRKEKEQADYVAEQLELLDQAGFDHAFVYQFNHPAYPAGEGAKDLDMVAFGLVKFPPAEDPRSEAMPPWERKEAFYSAADFFSKQSARVH
ncbi:hypothetical protein [Paenarthrobacter sp. NPDC057981]|uniref:hypothetical protein n=1 Tax=Paenarthrobacter sp. NPDC057981 TaxID=3346297 RepID=UPI0036DE4D9F